MGRNFGIEFIRGVKSEFLDVQINSLDLHVNFKSYFFVFAQFKESTSVLQSLQFCLI